MKNELDVATMLRLFEIVRQHGERDDSAYLLDGMTAWSDFDGYTVFLRHGETVLTLGFHSQYQFDYPDNAARQAFLDCSERLLRIHARAKPGVPS